MGHFVFRHWKQNGPKCPPAIFFYRSSSLARLLYDEDLWDASIMWSSWKHVNSNDSFMLQLISLRTAQNWMFSLGPLYCNRQSLWGCHVLGVGVILDHSHYTFAGKGFVLQSHKDKKTAILHIFSNQFLLYKNCCILVKISLMFLYNGVKVRVRISNFIPNFTGHVITYPCWD